MLDQETDSWAPQTLPASLQVRLIATMKTIAAFPTKLLEGSKRIMDVTHFLFLNAKSCITVKNYIIVGSTFEGPFWKVLYSS